MGSLTKYNQVMVGRRYIQVWQYMLEYHHSQAAVLVGSSTHNEQIECLWRDVFADLFREMENDGYFNNLDEVDLFCLHTTFLPRINKALDSFVDS